MFSVRSIVDILKRASLSIFFSFIITISPKFCQKKNKTNVCIESKLIIFPFRIFILILYDFLIPKNELKCFFLDLMWLFSFCEQVIKCGSEVSVWKGSLAFHFWWNRKFKDFHIRLKESLKNALRLWSFRCEVSVGRFRLTCRTIKCVEMSAVWL